MAREKMVTRTVDITVVSVMAMDTETAEVKVYTKEINGLFTEKSDALKAVQKLDETDTFKPAAIQTMEYKEVLYGMAESDFIKYAKILPPRGTKKGEQ